MSHRSGYTVDGSRGGPAQRRKVETLDAQLEAARQRAGAACGALMGSLGIRDLEALGDSAYAAMMALAELRSAARARELAE